MDIFFRTKKSLVKMKDKVEVEGKNYLTTSSLDGKEKCVLSQYDSNEKALAILNQIDQILDKAIKEKTQAISVNISSI